jgi:GTPase SAR1 family protein
MREHKVVVLGGMGSGKSTLVRSIAAGAVVDTDVANSDRLGADKASTTVALDYADIDLPNGERLRLYGTPGQQRFDFLWPILLQGARGAVLLLDARRAGVAAELEDYLQVLRPFASSWRWWWRSPISTRHRTPRWMTGPPVPALTTSRCRCWPWMPATANRDCC